MIAALTTSENSAASRKTRCIRRSRRTLRRSPARSLMVSAVGTEVSVIDRIERTGADPGRQGRHQSSRSGLGQKREPVETDLDLDELDAGVRTGLRFLVLDGPGGVGDVGVTGAEQLEAVAGAGTV